MYSSRHPTLRKKLIHSAHAKNVAISSNRFARYCILICIFLMHLVLILSWQKIPSAFTPTINSHTSLLVFSLPLQKTNTKENTKTNTQFIEKKAIQESTLTSRLSQAKHKNESENKKKFISSKSITITNQTPAPGSPVQEETSSSALVSPPVSTSVSPPAIEKNIRNLSQSLKEDFLKQEKNFRPDPKSNTESMKKFSNALADAALIQREGVIIEKKFAYDGRPVSKIKTPYGTYCVRHPKAGEKLELAPPPLPVTCGQL